MPPTIIYKSEIWGLKSEEKIGEIHILENRQKFLMKRGTTFVGRGDESLDSRTRYIQRLPGHRKAQRFADQRCHPYPEGRPRRLEVRRVDPLRWPTLILLVFWLQEWLSWKRLTIVPLLKKPPLAQNESVTTSMAVTLLVSVFHSAPHAWCPLICNGSPRTRSNMRMRVGETTIASRATIPVVPFWTKCQPRLSLWALEREKRARVARAKREDHISRI